MVVRKLASDRRMLAASPDYLDARCVPETPADIEDHASVILGGANRWEFSDGAVVHPQAGHKINDGEAVRLAIEAGNRFGAERCRSPAGLPGADQDGHMDPLPRRKTGPAESPGDD